jgi:hypothetical protein
MAKSNSHKSLLDIKSKLKVSKTKLDKLKQTESPHFQFSSIADYVPLTESSTQGASAKYFATTSLQKSQKQKTVRKKKQNQSVLKSSVSKKSVLKRPVTSPSTHKIIIPIFWDVDLTITEQYQQVPLFSSRFEQIKKRLANQGFAFKEEIDYFNWVDIRRGEMAVGYLQQMVWDAQKGGALDGLSNDELFKTGFLVEPSKGFVACLKQLKQDFPNVELHHFFVSVGIRPIIEGFVEKQKLKSYVKGIASGEFLEKNGRIVGIKSIVYPFSKNEHIIAFMKGNYQLLNKQLRKDQYKYDYENMIVIGDGFTDTAKFAYAKKKGGTPVAVYKKGDVAGFEKAVASVGDWVDFILPRDYSPGSITYNYIKQIVQSKLSNRSTFPYILLHEYKKGNLKDESVIALVKKALAQDETLKDYFTSIHVKPDGKEIHKCIYRI